MDIQVEEAPKNDRGFTLVELLIVIVILGILAAVTVFAVRGITDKSQENSCATEKRAIETATEAYFADTGADATAMADLVGTYLRTDPSARWTLTTGTPPTISATTGGDCDTTVATTTTTTTTVAP
ncbi:MAG: type II secretion system protein [Actinobacteria bacterium]|nr:type II secretion system protein [Actinomycetota bacterium]